MNRPKSLKATGHKIRTLTKHTNTMKCKAPERVRAMSVPADRKENIVYPRDNNMTVQSTSATPPISKSFARTSSSKSKGLSIRGKIKRDSAKPKQRPYTQDGSQPHKSSLIPIKLKSEIQVNKNESPKRLKISSSYHRADMTNDRYKLKEICFVKQNLTKKVIAKFNKDSEYDDNEDIVVAWDSDCSPRVLGIADLPESSTKCGFKVSEASTSSKVPSRGSLKSSSFMSNKVKRTKTSLRRLASANVESTNKVEKINKRKKLKTKMI